MLENLSDCLSPEEILGKLMQATRSFPEVRSIRLLCEERSHDSIVCVVEANPHAWPVAGALGGYMYGTMPAVTLAPLAAGFRCEGRREGKLISVFCAKCYVAD